MILPTPITKLANLLQVVPKITPSTLPFDKSPGK